MSSNKLSICLTGMLAFVVAMSVIPNALASCQIQFQTVDYPANVAQSQNIEVSSKILFSCTTSSVDITGRADLVDEITNKVLSSSPFDIGYITEPQKIITFNLTNSAQAPQASGTWKMKLQISLFAASQLFASAEQSFQIEVGATIQETLTEVRVVQNNGFEDDLTGWQVIGRPSGYSTISQKIAHSGSSSLQLNLLGSGQTVSNYQIQGVFQSTQVQDLRDLNIQAWFLVMHDSTAVAARLRVQVGDFTVNYYVAYGNKPQLDALDTARSKSVFVLNIAPGTDQWGKWVSISRDVKQDMESTFGLQGLAPFQQNRTTQVLIALEIMGFGVSSSQIMFWDDVSATAMSAASTLTHTSESVATSGQRTESIATTTSEGQMLTFNGLIPVAGVVVIVIVAAVLVVMRRKKDSTPGTTAVQATSLSRGQPVEAATTREANIPTGYPELDSLLAGGLPEGYAILLVSPPCDERDLLLRRIVESGIKNRAITIYVSRDIARTQDLVNRYGENFYALSPQADKITSTSGNLANIPDVENLNELNISLAKTLERDTRAVRGKLIILDILSDVLLRHRALTARKWLDGFVGKRKTEGYTILATLNPLIAPTEDTQTIIDLFDGIIEIYERELRERARRFLIVKKMYGRRYGESELMLDKDKLF